MDLFIFIAIISLIPHAYSMELPLSSCPASKPFRMDDSLCANFAEICIRQDSSQCKTFLSTCSQCPPSEYTISMLAALNKKINELSNLRKEINDSRNSVISSRKVNENLTKNGLNTIFVYFGLIFCGVLLLILFIWKICECVRNKNHVKKRKSSNVVSVDDIEKKPFINPNITDVELQKIDNTNCTHTDINKKVNSIQEKEDSIEKTQVIEKENLQCQNIDNTNSKVEELNKKVDDMESVLNPFDSELTGKIDKVLDMESALNRLDSALTGKIDKVLALESALNRLDSGLTGKIDKIALILAKFEETNISVQNSKLDEIFGLSNPLEASQEARVAIAEFDSKVAPETEDWNNKQ